jgi:hypothetical protein
LFEHTTSISNAKPGQAIWLQLDLESFEPIFEQGNFNDNNACTSKEGGCKYPQVHWAEVEFA